MHERNLIPTIYHGCKNVVVWECMVAAGPAKMIIVTNRKDNHMFLNILRPKKGAGTTKIRFKNRHFMFQEDKDPKPT